MRRGRRTAAVCLALLNLVAGCSTPPPAIPYGGELVVMAPSPDFAAELAHQRLPADWVTLGSLGSGKLAAVEFGGLPALRVVNGDTPFVAVRRTEARLSVTPYLSWAWHVTPPAEGAHPVHLLVGFRDGAAPEGREAAWNRLREQLPAHDRLLALAWGSTALSRGQLDAAPPGDGPPSRYVVRGGTEQGGQWHAETVDLSELHHRLWPRLHQDTVRIAFIGLAAAGGEPPTPMHIAAITLSR